MPINHSIVNYSDFFRVSLFKAEVLSLHVRTSRNASQLQKLSGGRNSRNMTKIIENCIFYSKL